MLILDCETPETTASTLSLASKVPLPDLLEAIQRADQSPALPWQDPSSALPENALAAVDVDIPKVAFDAAYYFHGTRTVDPRLFLADGIKPLGLVIDQFWDALHLLCADDIPAHRWQTIRRELEHDGPRSRSDDHSAWLYRFKQPDPAHHGPYASLIREHTVNPTDGQHDYLATPEIIRDIAGYIGSDLQAKFAAAATSCVVKFRHPEVGLHQIEAAIWYLHRHLNDEPLDWNTLHFIDCRNVAVPAVDVEYVDEIEPRSPQDHSRTNRRRHTFG
ncbi:hypothetical protein [Winogradskya humida]|uniref:Uncharacterized protein n=1 Tax=Winogradskya humida TaxID=113566 RepID=A0ABQ4A800_9ACTN|nr:hypothetical protein [Actinoplanes humidus]GIE26768.1 hypothetical protein Ahu01nite_098700 [Actinoplanes humidus]